MDFTTTRTLIDQLPHWVSAFAATLPPPKRLPPTGDIFRWEYEAKDAPTLQVAKAVRMASGLRAAMTLADLGHAVESAVLLRTVADFAAEILFIGEGLMEGRFTTEQQQFIDQHFAPFPVDPDELASREREYYVGRKAIAKAQDRMMDKTGAPKDLLAKYSAFLNKGYDTYVHGHSVGVMELYSGRTMSFMMAGTESEHRVCVAKVGVAGKLKEALLALRFMAMTRGLIDLAGELRAAFEQLDASGEDSKAPGGGS